MSPNSPLKEESSPVSIIVRDLDGNISLWNPSAECFYGWSAAQAVGSVTHALFHTEFPDDLATINKELLDRGVWEGVLHHRLKDGRRVCVRSRWELQRHPHLAVFEINRRIDAMPPGNLIPFPKTNVVAGAPRAAVPQPNQTSEHGARRWLHLWWIVPALLVLAGVVWFLSLTHHSITNPLE